MTTPTNDEGAVVRLDLGSGPTPPDGYMGIDLDAGTRSFPTMLARDSAWAQPGSVYSYDLGRHPWPIHSDVVDELRASHYVEHIAAPYTTAAGSMRFPLVEFMRDVYRVCRHGATVEIIWPALQSVRAFQDPTHCLFIPPQLWAYTDRRYRQAHDLDRRPYPHDVHMVCTDVGVIPLDDKFTMRPPQAQEDAARLYWNVMADCRVVLRVCKHPDPELDQLPNALGIEGDAWGDWPAAAEDSALRTTARVDSSLLLERWETGA